MSSRDLHIYSKKLKCLDITEIALQGSYNTDRGNNLMIVFERCRSDNKLGVKCKREADIDDWLQNKYIVTLENEQRFIANEFEGDRIDSMSKIVWHALSPDIRFDYVKNV